MIKTFTQYTPPLIHFGAGKLELLPSLIKQYGQRVLILTGSGSIKHSASWRKFEKHLTAGNLTISRESITSEPSPELIDRIVDSYREPLPDVVAAAGGGSVMDAGKAVSAMLKYDSSVIHYLEGIGTKTHDGRKVPFIAVPTTSGTGSEATKNAVLSRVGPDGFKKSLRHDKFVPDIALVDPLLTLSCPPELTAATGMDAFTQLLESYVSASTTPLTDALAFSGLQSASRSLEKAVQDGYNLEARTDMAYASMISGITLANAGLGLVHGFASSIGGLFPIPHGVVCGTLMAPCMELTIRRMIRENKDHPAISKFAGTGKLFAPESGKNDFYYCEYLIEKLFVMSEKLRLPRLSDYGITENDFMAIIRLTENKNNPVRLPNEDFQTILAKRL